MKAWLYALAGALAVLAFSILSGPGRKVKKLTQQRDDLILEGSTKAKAKAQAAGIKADKHQANALEAGRIGQAVIDTVGQNDESIRSVLDSWRADRVQ